jgi:hypothetical protein
MSQNQSWESVITGGQSDLYPSTHGVFVNAEQADDLFHRIVAVDLDETVVGAAFSHDRYPPLKLLSYERLPASPPDRELRRPTSLQYVQRSGPLLHWQAIRLRDRLGSLAS